MKIYRLTGDASFKRYNCRYRWKNNDLALLVRGSYAFYRMDEGGYYYLFGIDGEDVPARFKPLFQLLFDSERIFKPVEYNIKSSIALLNKNKKLISKTLLKEISEVASA